MDTLSKECLMKYVNHLDLNLNTTNAINQTIINYGQKLIMTLYRGCNTNYLTSTYWFSTSSSKDVAKYEFAGLNGYTFIIHVDDAMILDVNLYLSHNQGNLVPL